MLGKKICDICGRKMTKKQIKEGTTRAGVEQTTGYEYPKYRCKDCIFVDGVGISLKKKYPFPLRHCVGCGKNISRHRLKSIKMLDNGEYLCRTCAGLENPNIKKMKNKGPGKIELVEDTSIDKDFIRVVVTIDIPVNTEKDKLVNNYIPEIDVKQISQHFADKNTTGQVEHLNGELDSGRLRL